MSRITTGVSGWALTASVVGAVLAYSGLRGKQVSNTFKNVIAGRKPSDAPQLNPIAAPISGINADPISQTPGSDAATPGMLARAGGRRGIVTAAAMSQQGKPYVWDTPLNFNTPNPQSFDCSGLTGWCYAKIGVTLPHFTGSQYMLLSHAPFSDVQPGDLVFYSRITIYHVAIYLGNGQVIEAPEPGTPVRIRPVHAGDTDLMPTVGVLPGG